jgi:hypothetical protein
VEPLTANEALGGLRAHQAVGALRRTAHLAVKLKRLRAHAGPVRPSAGAPFCSHSHEVGRRFAEPVVSLHSQAHNRAPLRIVMQVEVALLVSSSKGGGLIGVAVALG